MRCEKSKKPTLRYIKCVPVIVCIALKNAGG